MAIITFYIVRHGKTVMNELDLVQGWSDSPLTAEGSQDAEDLGKGLKDIPFHGAYCSTLNRTKQTLELILEAKNEKHLPIHEMEGLKEASFGMYEFEKNSLMWGLIAQKMGCNSIDEFFSRLNDKKASMADALDIVREMDTTGIAEDFATLKSRLLKTLRKIAKKESADGKDKNILVVSHGISIFSLMLGLDAPDDMMGPIYNTSVSKVVYNEGRFNVESVADLSYLERGREEGE